MSIPAHRQTHETGTDRIKVWRLEGIVQEVGTPGSPQQVPTEKAIRDAISAGGSAFPNATYLTENDETSDLPNSRQLLAGSNVTFDDTVAGERTVNVSGGSGMVQIVETILGSDAATISFSSIPGTYRHLRIIGYGRITESVTDNYVYLQFNGDTGANYDEQRLIGNNASALAAEARAQTKARVADFTAASSSTSTQPGLVTIDVPHYAGTTFDKIATSVVGLVWGTTAGTLLTGQFFQHWRSTAAITSITFLLSTGNFKAGTVFSLYGLP